jgi:protein Mpv17
MWSRYASASRHSPLLVSALTGGAVMALGDAAAQALERRRGGGAAGHDWRRGLVTASWNGLVFTPIFFVWFRKLDRVWPGASPRAVLAKVAANQMCMVLPMNVGFIAWTTVLERASSPESAAPHQEPVAIVIERTLRERLQRIWFTSASVWIPVNLLNFALVPPEFRVLPTIATSLVWNFWLSYTCHKESASDHIEEAQVAR